MSGKHINSTIIGKTEIRDFDLYEQLVDYLGETLSHALEESFAQ